MANPKTDEPVYYFEWDGEKHTQYDATLRVLINSPNAGHPKVHLTVLRFDESYENVNNIENVEFQNDMTGISYWLRRYSQWPRPGPVTNVTVS